MSQRSREIHVKLLDIWPYRVYTNLQHSSSIQDIMSHALHIHTKLPMEAHDEIREQQCSLTHSVIQMHTATNTRANTLAL